jgi:hypothetical protein
MSFARAALWALTIAGCALGLALLGSRAAHARDRAAAAREQYLQVCSDLKELATLAARADPRLAAAGAQPLSSRLSAAAAQAGLPASCISSVSPEAQLVKTTGSGARVLQRRAAVALAGLTLPQFGGLLEQWRHANPDWVVTAIDITPAPGPPPAAGGDLPLSIGLTLESLATAGGGTTGAAR